MPTKRGPQTEQGRGRSSGDGGKALDRAQGAVELDVVEREVDELSGEVVVVGGHVEVAVPGEVEEDRPLDTLLVRACRGLQRAVDRVRRLGRRDDPLVA